MLLKLYPLYLGVGAALPILSLCFLQKNILSLHKKRHEQSFNSVNTNKNIFSLTQEKMENSSAFMALFLVLTGISISQSFHIKSNRNESKKTSGICEMSNSLFLEKALIKPRVSEHLILNTLNTRNRFTYQTESTLFGVESTMMLEASKILKTIQASVAQAEAVFAIFNFITTIFTFSSCVWKLFRNPAAYWSILPGLYSLVVLLMLFSSMIPTTIALTAYDCKDVDTAHISYSLLDLPNCAAEIKEETATTQTIQLLQPRESRQVPFIACNVEFRQTFFVCGRYSYLYVKPEHITSGVVHISRERCQAMHHGRTYHAVNAHIINNLKSNSTIKISVTVAGSVDNDGNCENGDLLYEGGTLNGLIIREYEISLQDGLSSTDITSGVTKFTKRYGCRLHEDHCSIADLGDIYIYPYVPRNCDEERYKAIFEGHAKISLFTDGTYKSVLVETEEIAFDLLVQDTERVCGRILHRTEHPSLFLDLQASAMFMRNVEKVNAEELQLLTYINTKLLYFSKRIGENFKSLETALAQKRCQHQTETIKNRAALATINPELFAFSMNSHQPGMSGKVSGEVVHLFKCVIKSVTRRNNTETCFEELPVTYEGKDYFVTPLNRILTPVGSPRKCSDPYPSCYNAGEVWFSLDPNPQECPVPETIQLEINTTKWQYQQIRSLAAAGIYTPDELKAWEAGLVMPAETRTRERALSARYYGTSSYTAGGSGLNLMTNFEIKLIGEEVWGAMKTFVNFMGETTSIIIGFVSLGFMAGQCISCSLKNWQLIRFHGCSVKGLISLLPGGQFLVWAKDRVVGTSQFEKLMSLTPVEMVKLHQKTQEAYEVLGLEFVPHIYPNIEVKLNTGHGPEP